VAEAPEVLEGVDRRRVSRQPDAAAYNIVEKQLTR